MKIRNIVRCCKIGTKSKEHDMLTKPILIGHRGFCGSYPENTLISFEKAIEMGVSAVEFDVHLTNREKVI